MSAFKLNSLPGVNGISEKLSTTLPGVGIPNVLGQDSATSQKSTGLLSGFGQAAPKSSSTISDKFLKLFFRIISFLFSILRKLIPSSIQNFLVFIIPPLLMFYESALRVYFPRLPSLVKIAFTLYQRGILTMGTVVWLASSLPGDLLGGLGAISGAAMQTTAALAGGAAAVGNTLAAGATHAVAEGLSIVKDGQTAVTENIAHLVSGEHAIAPGNLVPDVAKGAIGATQAAATESVAKVANVLESMNPLHLNIGPKESQAAQPNSLGSLLQPKLPGFK